MDRKALFAPLFAGALVLGFAGIAQADPFYLDLSAGGGVDGHVDGDFDGDQVTATNNQLTVYAETLTTQFDTDGSGDLSDGDRFSDFGHLDVQGFSPNAFGNEGLNANYQITADWSDLTGTSTGLTPVGPNFVSQITYDAVGNTTFDFYIDSLAGGITPANYGGNNSTAADDVGATFTDGVPVLSILIVGGQGTNTFDAAGNFITGSSILQGIVTAALPGLWFFADGDLDFNTLIGSMVEIFVTIDQNTDDVQTILGPCFGAPGCGPDGVLLQVGSNHDGSIDFKLVPEPASVLLFGIGFLALGGISLVSRRREA